VGYRTIPSPHYAAQPQMMRN